MPRYPTENVIHMAEVEARHDSEAYGRDYGDDDRPTRAELDAEAAEAVPNFIQEHHTRKR